MIKVITTKSILVILLLMVLSNIEAQSTKAVNTNITKEAQELLDYIYSISGKKTLAGQHCAPQLGSTRLSVVHRQTGKYPALFGQDFGFSFPGYWDGINYRQNIVDEAIRRHQDGFINTIMWHAVPPTMDEPVKFREAIQSDLSDEEWKEMVTPGTYLNEKWKSQVDVIAWFLKQLQYADVPILWRPYHEMNGNWFWWGKKDGDDGYKKLWAMMYDRLTNFHGLNNLIWVYNTNEYKLGVSKHAKYYPGHDLVDILATDVYSEGFNEENYNQMVVLAGNKPIALGEVGQLPSPKILKDQPRWTWFMNWGNPGGRNSNTRETYNEDKVVKHSDLPWVDLKEVKLHYPLMR